MSEKKVFFEGELGKVCGILNESENKDEIVIIIHGFSSHKNTSAKISAKILQKLEISSLRIDLDNMGESEFEIYNASVSNYIKQIEAATKFVLDLGYENISLIGSSFGGPVAIGYAMKHNVKRMFLRCPGAGAYFRYLKKGNEEAYEEVKKIGYELKEKSDGKKIKVGFECVEDLKNYYPLSDKVNKFDFPICIVHGNEDKVIPHSSSVEIAKNLKRGELKTIEDAGHDLSVNGDFSLSQKYLKEFFEK